MAGDTITISFKKERVLRGPDTLKMLPAPQHSRFDHIRILLQIICRESERYALIAENCWWFVSILLYHASEKQWKPNPWKNPALWGMWALSTRGTTRAVARRFDSSNILTGPQVPLPTNLLRDIDEMSAARRESTVRFVEALLGTDEERLFNQIPLIQCIVSDGGMLQARFSIRIQMLNYQHIIWKIC